MYKNNDFMNYIGFRSTEIETRINNVVNEILSSDGHVSIDLSDLNLTESEQVYVEREIERKVHEAIH